MRCQECLAELATGSLRDLTPESEVMRHCATCPDCGPLATLLRDREYSAATILNTLPPISNPSSVAETAGMVSHRRRVGKVVVFLTGAALAATIFISIAATDVGRMMFGLSRDPPALETETIPLTCLTPDQAAQLVAQYIPANGRSYTVTSPRESRVSVITIHGTARQIAKSRSLIREVEGNPRSCYASPANVVNDILKRFGGPPPAGPAAPAVQPSAAPTVKIQTERRK